MEKLPGEENLTEKRIDSIAKQVVVVPKGEHWIVRELLKSDVSIEPGAKLTVLDVAAKSNIRVEEGGVFDVRGQDLKNELYMKNEGNYKSENGSQEMNKEDGPEKGNETAGWSIVKMIKNGQYEEAKQILEQNDVVLNGEMIETIGWIFVRKVKEGDVESAQAIQDQFKIELSEEMNSTVNMLKGKQEEKVVDNAQDAVSHEDVEKNNDYIKEKNGWFMKELEKQKGEKECSKCGNVNSLFANFCGKCGSVFEDKNSVGPLKSSLTKNQFSYLRDIKMVLDNHDIGEEEATVRLIKINIHHGGLLSSEEREDVMRKYKQYINVE